MFATRWVTTRNAAGQGGDVVLLTDDYHAPLVGVSYAHSQRSSRVRVDSTLCIKSEHYGDQVGPTAQGMCPEGEVLTGLAGIGGSQYFSISNWMPRCAAPAGWAVATDSSAYCTTPSLRSLSGASDDHVCDSGQGSLGAMCFS